MSPLKINGWTIYAHPLFLEQVDALTDKVKRLQAKDPAGYQSKPATKRLAAIVKLALNDIPQDPSGPQYRQGNTLGTTHTHWQRAKFYPQYQLSFRYDLASKILIYAWVNDESTQRAYDSKHDAYAVFRKMLKNGNPPDSWGDLWQAAC
ncbi:type II toxin-antitoxin system YhaV family toxin [Chromohalobacter nigrandesensis]|uniref:type II toxin-antitoxin system YhaV family toxin n=1 Tax=Chromohalobacter nigrandesensis TaxID=119863 RepID=UPI001FF5E6FF|nr:type II toxin-antitoxin system YhaV family toxin [Chromohalobacter nigrandesensis]MCK0744893.1 type II toxin-antitoxin system YhaV family toxin [Chromohalobacter nigrandesensis]